MQNLRGWPIVLLGVGLVCCTDESDAGSGGDQGPSGEGEGEGEGARRVFPGAVLGEARAGFLGALADLPDAPTDFTGAQPGDLILVNDQIVAVVRATEAGLTVPGFHGGGLVDLHRRGIADTLREHIVMIGFREVKPHAFDVVADGSDGGVAIVRVEGEDTDIHIIPKEFPISSGEPLGATLVTEYSLGPMDDFVTLVTTVTKSDVGLESLLAGDGLYISHPSEPFLPGSGRDGGGAPLTSASHVVQGGIAMVADPPNPAGLAVSIDNITLLLPGDIQLGGGAPGVYTRRFYVGDPDAAPAHLAARVLEFEDIFTGTLEVSGVPADSVIEVRAGAGKLAAVGDARGPFPVPAGEMTVRAFLDGRGGEEISATISAGDLTTMTLDVPESATLTLAATDDDGKSIPARALVFPAGGDRIIALLPPGGVEVRVPPGEMRVLVSRGFEYEVHDETLSLDSGGVGRVDAVLDHVVQTPGRISTDTHIHSIWSTDSNVPEHVRILSIAAEGIEMPVATDHDQVTAYRVPPELAEFVNPIIGTETSTSDYGHFNGYPLVVSPGAPRNGSPDWLGLQPAEIFANMRASGAIVIQANHPDSGNGKGYFTAFGFDEAGLPLMDLGFDTVEVYNRGEDDRIDKVLESLHKILNTGKQVGFVGVSDSHDLSRWVGHPRSHVLVGTDDPHEVTPEEFARAIKEGKTVVTGGPYIEASVQQDDEGGPVTVTIRVQAPSWVPVDRVVIVTPDGEVAERTDMAQGTVRFDGEITVDAPSGPGPGWLYVRADSASRMEPIMGGRVFSATSPFYLQ